MRKYIVYILFAFSVAFGIHFHLLGSDKNPERLAMEGSQLLNPEVVTTQQQPKEMNERVHKWGVSPFKSSPVSKKPPLQLTGISFSDDDLSYAVVNNKIVQTGDEINGWNVKSINPGYVEVAKRGMVEKLTLESSLE